MTMEKWHSKAGVEVGGGTMEKAAKWLGRISFSENMGSETGRTSTDTYMWSGVLCCRHRPYNRKRWSLIFLFSPGS